MPRTKTTPPREPTREKGQRSLDLPAYLTRVMPQFRQPAWMKAELWRQFVRKQPIAMVTRDTLISNLLSLDWKIEPVESNQRDELKDEIREYTDFFEYDGNYDYTERTERLLEDALDTPFGGAMETIRVPDSSNGKVVELVPIDAATLYPTLSADFPVGQYLELSATDTIYFPAYAINRIYSSPRPEIMREGWGMAPPEKIYLAMEMLGRGDKYYADLLLDIPEAGILDLMDMDQESAVEWAASFKDTVLGVDGFRIPLLYEHTQPAKFIPFRLSPGDMIFDDITTKYAGIVVAGYGMTLSDIGFASKSSGGETLAGSIRGERKTRKTAIAKWKLKLAYWHNRILPDYLRFMFIDLDDELAVAKGRARLANATALTALVDKGIITPDEGRQQMIADGLFSISMPEEAPEIEVPQVNSPERPSMLGRPIAPSEGGHGEVLPRSAIERALGNYLDVGKVLPVVEDLVPVLSPSVQSALFNDEDEDGIWSGLVDEFVAEYQNGFDDPQNLDELLVDQALSLMSIAEPENLDTVSIAESYLYIIENLIDRSLTEQESTEIVDKLVDKAENILYSAREQSKSAILSGIVEGLQNPMHLYSLATLDSQELLSDNKLVNSIVLAIKSRFEKINHDLIEQYADKITEIIKDLEA